MRPASSVVTPGLAAAVLSQFIYRRLEGESKLAEQSQRAANSLSKLHLASNAACRQCVARRTLDLLLPRKLRYPRRTEQFLLGYCLCAYGLPGIIKCHRVAGSTFRACVRQSSDLCHSSLLYVRLALCDLWRTRRALAGRRECSPHFGAPSRT